MQSRLFVNPINCFDQQDFKVYIKLKNVLYFYNLDPDPGPWNQILDLDPGPQTPTLDPDPEKPGINIGLKNMSDFR